MQLEQILLSNGACELSSAMIIDPEAIKAKLKEDKNIEFGSDGCGIKAGIVVSINNVNPLVEILFEAEREEYSKMNAAPMPGKYVLLKTDSSRMTIGHTAFEYIIDQILDEYHYSNDDQSYLETCFADVFANSVIFGSRAGEDIDYTKRDIPVPTPKEKETNKKKPICVEFLITPQYIVGRVTDTGKGITNKKYEEVRKYAVVPDDWKELNHEEQIKYMKSYGRGLYMLEITTGEKPFFQKKFAFSTSFLMPNSESKNDKN